MQGQYIHARCISHGHQFKFPPILFQILGCASAMMKSPISHLNFQQFDFSSILDYKREGFVGRKWFFMELDNIFETDRGTAGALITGDPGSGKSTLLSQLICSPYFQSANPSEYHRLSFL